MFQKIGMKNRATEQSESESDQLHSSLFAVNVQVFPKLSDVIALTLHAFPVSVYPGAQFAYNTRL